MEDNLKDNFSNDNNDNNRKRQKKVLEIKAEEDILDNIDMPKDSMKNLKTLSNLSNDKEPDINQNNDNKEEVPILEYKTKYNTLETNQNVLDNELKNNQKKKVEKKVNRNLKLLKIVKERMKEQKYKNMFEEQKIKNEMVQDNENKVINNNENDLSNTNKEEPKKEIEKEKEANLPKENISQNKDEEKKSKLLNIISSKKYNKFQRRETEKKENENEKEEIVAVPDKDKSRIYKSIDVVQRARLNANIRTKANINIKKEKQYSVNKENDSSSKKGKMKILELLKMKKKEQNENENGDNVNKEISNKNIQNNEVENENIHNNNKIVDSYSYKPKKKITEKPIRDRNLENSLPKKNFRDEEEEEKSFDYHNRTQQQFRNYKTINTNKIPKSKEMYSKLNNYFNTNNNSIEPDSVNDNNNVINDSYIKKYQNYNTNRLNNNNNNPNDIKNKFREKIKNNRKINNDIPINPNYKYINKNARTIDYSFDAKKSKIPSIKKVLNRSLINSKIYRPKKASNNNSPKKDNLYQFERNTINTENVTNGINNNFQNNKYLDYTQIKQNHKAYIKKSPKKYEGSNDFNNNTIENEKNSKIKYKKLLGGYKNRNNFNTINNNFCSSQKKRINLFNSLYSSKNTYKESQEYNITENNFYNINKNPNKFQNLKGKLLKNPQNQNSMIFNIEDLMVLEERLNDIIYSLETNDNIENKCFNFLNYYFNCSLYNLLEKIFQNKEDSNIVRLSINYELISIMVCYEYSFEIDPTEKEIYLQLLELMDLNHNNLIIICEYILTKIIPESKPNIWVIKLEHMIKNYKLSNDNTYMLKNSSQDSVEKISFNLNLIIKSLKNILLNYPTEYSDILISLLKKIDTKTYEEINDFFREYILRVDNFEGSIIASSYLKKNKFFKPFPAPYLVSRPSKPYTLILDLDETLVHFQIKSNKGGTLRARPYLFGFLEEMGHYFELVVWTSATEAYANSLIDAIEYEKKYFDYILYREHAIIIGDDFVKDLTRVGRGLDRIIIIDDMPQNFRLQKENGITIKPFFGDDLDDSALYELVPILKHIAEDEYDVRIGLEKYREEIIKRITSNISKHNIY